VEEDEEMRQKGGGNVEDDGEMGGRVSVHEMLNPNPMVHSAGHQRSSGVARHDDAPV